jgi:hypothetical protein
VAQKREGNERMSRYKPKTVPVAKDLREKARYIYTSWEQALREHARREATRMAPELRSDTLPIIKNSLAAAICMWIESHPDSWAHDWEAILARVREKDSFLCNGYKNLPAPNLAWLFSHSKNNDLGINRILDGTIWTNKSRYFSSEDGV